MTENKPAKEWYSLTEMSVELDVDRKALAALIEAGKLLRGRPKPKRGGGFTMAWTADDLEYNRKTLRNLERLKPRKPRNPKPRQ